MNARDSGPIGVALALRALPWLGAALASERERWALWVPVAFGLGIAVYFALPDEPPWGLGAALTALAALLAAARWRRFVEGDGAWFVAWLALGLVGAGFTAAHIRTAQVSAPVLAERVGPTTVTGRVAEVEMLPEATRVTLDKPRVVRVAPHRTPERVRVRLPRTAPELVPGQWLSVRAVLSPPPAPAAPGAYDFQRAAFFQRLGAVGFAVGSVEIVAEPADDAAGSFALALQRLRQAITATVRDTIGGPAGAVAAALMTGDRAAIPKDLMDAIRDSGLAHLLAISGLHIGLVAGILFVGVRGALALVPPLALRHPIKKWAAVAAIPGAAAYALISGATVPTQRAFLMIGLVLIAVVVDRRGLSMRLVAWAALVVLALQPESLLGPSFQMSFAAVVALIAGWEVMSARRRFDETPAFWRRGMFRYLGGVALTTLIAGTATAPFALYHFNRYALYGLVANMIAVPATALWIMPWAVLAFLLMPFGLEGLALAPMGWGVALVNAVAREVAAWPGAVALLPAMPTWGLALVTAGGLWLSLWRRRWRLAGLGAVAAGMVSIALVRPPDILIDAGGLVAVRGDDGSLAVSSARAGRFTREAWLRQAGLEADAAQAWPASGTSADGRLACDGLGCIVRAHGHAVALVKDRAALIEDCWRADVVVSTIALGRDPCRGRAKVIDGRAFRQGGAHALWLTPDGVRIESVNANRGRRPWVLRGGGQRRGER